MLNLAGKLRRAGLTGEEIEPILLRKVHEECEGPIDDSKVKKMAHSIESFPEGSPANELVLFEGRPAGSSPGQMVAPDEMAELLPFRIIGAEQEPNGDFRDTVCVFSTEMDAEIARSLGFNSIAVLEESGDMLFQTSVTILKAKYERAAIFAKTEGTTNLHHAINPGSIFVGLPINNLAEPKIGYGNRKVFPPFSTLLEAKLSSEDAFSDVNIEEHIRKTIGMAAVRNTKVLRSSEEIRTRVTSVFDQGRKNLETYDTRVVVASAMDSLRKLQFLDGRFPKPLTSKSLHGLLGDFVDLAYPTTVACREMILYEMLPMIGVLLGANYYLPYGSDKHFPSLFSLAIGRTTDGKGQAMHHCQQAIELIDPGWFKENMHSNPASGEGLVRMLAGRNLIINGRKNRVAIVNSEMSTSFNAQARKDSTLSGHLRAAYDGDRIENFRSDSKKSFAAENYILGLCGLITPKELQQVMPTIDWTNGAANRFLWSIGFKDKELGRSSKAPYFQEWALRVRKLVDLNTKLDAPIAIDYAESGRQVWDDWHYSLPAHQDDILSESQARAAANCARVANLYAQLDERRLDGWPVQLEACHVEAAIEIVDRSRQSVEWYLAQQTVPDSAKASYEDIQKIKTAMVSKVRETGEAVLTGTEVYNLFSNRSASQRDEICLQAGFKIGARKPEHGGKPAVIWTSQN